MCVCVHGSISVWYELCESEPLCICEHEWIYVEGHVCVVYKKCMCIFGCIWRIEILDP